MKTMLIALTVLMAAFLCACNPDSEESPSRPPIVNPGDNPDQKPDGGENDPENPPQTTRNMKITIGSATFTATLADNPTAEVFGQMLPMSISMSEMNGNEKYYNLSSNLPTAASNPGTIRTGDLMLYGSSTLVLFYKSFSTSYSYTRVGRIDNPSELEAALGRGSITVKFEATNE